VLENPDVDECHFHQRGAGTVRSEPSSLKSTDEKSRAIQVFESVALLHHSLVTKIFSLVTKILVTKKGDQP